MAEPKQLAAQDEQRPSEPHHNQDGNTISRLEAFSDGVFAIAITLLVLEIPTFLGHAPGKGSLLEQMAEEWPKYLMYVVSFLIIGIIWLNHHITFRYIQRVNRPLLMLNVLLLMAISFIPHASAVLGDNFRAGHADDKQAAAVLYTGTQLLTAIFYFSLWTYAIRARLVNPSISGEQVRAMTRSYLFGPVFYTLTFILSFFSIEAALVFYALAALYFLIPRSMDRF